MVNLIIADFSNFLWTLDGSCNFAIITFCRNIIEIQLVIIVRFYVVTDKLPLDKLSNTKVK